MKKRVIIGVVALLMLAVGLALVDHRFKRPDRVRYELETERIWKVQETILLFGLDRERYPSDLAELVPAYLADSAIRYRASATGNATKQYRYDAESGVLAWREPFRFNGIFPQTKPLTHTVQLPKIARDTITRKPIFQTDTTSTVLGDDAIVIEAEMFQQHTYGWEIHQSDAASGHSYIYIKEGAGDLSDVSKNTDFYNVGGDKRRIEARVLFNAPAAGQYYLRARLMAQRRPCSNSIGLQINDDPMFSVASSSRSCGSGLSHMQSH
jgi:hypothetical protein